ncbi:MAG: DNA/RNA helicase domain-containing protein, partial [Candidatus Omnitrophota bacterium]
MLIYQNNLDKFRQDVIHNRIADIMKDNFEGFFGRRVTPSEYQSWGNSSQHVRNVLDLAGLSDNMICMEYEVPYNTGRIDCMLFGKGEDGKSYAVLLELKQWSRVEEIEDEDNYQVETFTGGDLRKVAHPSQQVGAYHSHLLSFVQIFETDKDFCLNSSAYCHNYQKISGQGLFAERYAKIVEQFPIYTKADVEILAQKLKRLLSKGSGFEIFNRFMQSRIQPSKKLLENASKIIDNNQAVFSLLNEQLVAKNVIMAKVRLAEKKKTKSVISVHGGPGTGKTVIAVNVLADLARRNKTVFYGCKSKPFSEALKKVVGPESKILFSNLTRFVPSKVQEDSIDVVLIDEAHRIGKTSNSQYTASEDRTDMPQIDQLIRCAKTAVFFIDDAQIVRSQEVGSSALIRAAAEKFKAGYEDVQLISQFRCAGSDNYLDWLEYVLGYKEKPADFSKDDRFEFKIFDDPNVLYSFIKEQEAKKANSARMVAGYCWPWSKELNEDGTLVKDVVIAERNFA